MTSKHSPPLHRLPPRSPAAADSADLATQIDYIEQRLIDREAWLRSATESLTQRAQRAVTPKPWVLPVAGSALVVWLAWRLLHRRDRQPQPPVSVQASANVAAAQKEVMADLPWAGLTALAWPHTPLSWRERVSPAAAAAVVSTVLSIGRRLLRRRGR